MATPHHKMVATERKEALWGERAHLPVRRELQGAAFLREMVKRVCGFRKAGPTGTEHAFPPREAQDWCPLWPVSEQRGILI